MKPLFYRIGVALQGFVLAGHLYVLRNGLPIPTTDDDGKLLSRLMATYEIKLFGADHTIDQVLNGYDYSWAALLLFAIVASLFVLRSRRLSVASKRSFTGWLTLLWLANAVVAHFEWGVPQQILMALLFVTFLVSWWRDWRAPKPVDTRVLVVGAGLSGLSAAWHLEKKGYVNVTVVEKEDRIGGKCLTHVTDRHGYDMGGHEMLAGYTDLLDIADELGVPTRTSVLPLVYDRAHGAYLGFSKAATQTGGYNLMQVGLASLKYLWLVGVRFRRFTQPGTGLANMPPELGQSVGDWLRYRKLLPLQSILSFVIKAQGYGGYSDSPAAYLLKFQGFRNWASLLLANLGFSKKWPRVFVNGAENFCERIAAALRDVRTGTTIRRIERDRVELRNGVKVWFEGADEPQYFDRLVLATPLDPGTLSFLDLRDEERKLFAEFQTIPVYMTLGRVQGLPSAVTAMLPLDTQYLKEGNCTGFIKDYDDEPYAFFLSLVDPARMDGRYVADHIAEVLSTMPAYDGVQPRLLECTYQKTWNYFPHVTQEQLSGRFYDRLEALQGSNQTWMVGSSMSFEIMGNCVAYSKRVVTADF